MKKLYDEITKWQDQVFTKATPESCANHLEEEVEEIQVCLESGFAPDEEIADAFMLLIGLCNKLGLTYEEIEKEITRKFEINKKRKWGEVNEKGYVKHINTSN